MTTQTSLSLSNIRVTRRTRNILSVDHLTIYPGEFVGVIGPNGAGKTTLLKTCAGLINPEKGNAQINDNTWKTLSLWNRARLRRTIGYIPQAAEYNPDLPFTLREIVAMGRAGVKPLLSPLRHADYEFIDYWIEKLGLTRLRSSTFTSLSGGERQKALIARAMTQQPDLLMLDEPCVNLDFDWKQQFTEIIDQLYQQTNITVLMVSHEINLLPQSCQRVLLMRNGKIVADGPVRQVLSPETLEKAYHCRIHTTTVGKQTFVTAAQKQQQSL